MEQPTNETAARPQPNTASPPHTSRPTNGTSDYSRLDVSSNGQRLTQNTEESLTPSPQDAAAPSEAQLNPRSCITCRRRKVRCNKHHPCSNCIKAKIECIFPSPGRAPRKTRKPRNGELLARLRTLETIVQNMNETGGDAPGDAPGGELNPTEKPTSGIENQLLSPVDGGVCPGGSANKETGSNTIEKEFGKLVVGEDKSRYVSHHFWTNIGDTIQELKGVLDPPSSDDDEFYPPEHSALPPSERANHDGFLFGFWCLAHSLREFHPPCAQLDIIWEIYSNNVAPVLPIFHRPTLKRTIYDGAASLDSLNRNTEVLIFAVYYATVSTMTCSECACLLGEERTTALKRYRFAVEQALARANLLNSQSFVLLQGLVLYLFCVRRADDSRYVWSMTSLAVRMAQGIGLHRDGSSFGLTPFETEMRRRLWWHLCALDFRAAEDHGCDPSIHEATYDTNLPLNINDSDIYPEMKEAPKNRDGCTDMTFSLIRCEVIIIGRRLSFVPASSSCRKVVAGFSLAEREEMIENLNKRLECRYVRHCDMSTPIDWTCATVSRLTIARLWLMVYQPMNQAAPGSSSLATETHDRLFLTSIEIIEFSHLLETNTNTAKWSWFFRVHVQWHAIAFVLSELCVRRNCPMVNRAWRAINMALGSQGFSTQGKKGMLWPAIRKLMERAVRFREAQGLQYMTDSPSIQSKGDAMNAGAPLADPTTPYLTPESQNSNNMLDMLGFGQQIATDSTADPNNFPFQSNPQQGDITTNTWSLPAENTVEFTGLDPTTGNVPSWADWDQVVREFQSDITQGGQGDPPSLPVWFEGI